MDMTSSEWISAIGQTLLVVLVAFTLLCVVTSWVRFQLMAESARENEELGQGEDKQFRVCIMNQIAAARRQRQPFSVLLLRVSGNGAAVAEIQSVLRRLLRAGDIVMSCGDDIVGIMALCGSERTPALVKRLMAEAASAGTSGSEQWRFGVSGYPEHGFKTSVLYRRAREMLDAASSQNDRILGMADAEAVSEGNGADSSMADPLTGLIHEEKMIGVMRRYVAQERRADRPVSMVYFMIDQLERLVDTHGQKATDEMIKELAGRLSKSSRESDMLARFGGGGFILTMPASPSEALAVAQRIIQDVRKQAFAAGSGMKASLSAGVSGYPEVVGTAVQYFVAAEAALNQARLRGRSQCLVYERSMTLRAENETTTQHL